MTQDASRPVRVRFAPSPTGFLHVGGLRTALYNWFFARKHAGTFVLRIEDTDQTRLVEGAVEGMVRTLGRVGLPPDEGMMLRNGILEDVGPHGPYLQTKRRERHLAYAKQLIEADHAYYCFCTQERLDQVAEQQRLSKTPMMYDRRCRTLPPEESERRVANGEEHVIRLAVPLEGSLAMEDMIRGRIEIRWEQVDDQVLIKSDGLPTYHLAATCDDHDMEISHVLRADEWISSLPKHLFIARCLGWTPPAYAHLPLLLNPDHSKLSKRQGDVAVEDYFAKGYLPDALVNFVALLGWNPTNDREIFTKEELAGLFDVTKVNKAGAVFNVEKLDWMNGEYLKRLSAEAYLAYARPFLSEHGDGQAVDRACMLVRDRMRVGNALPSLISFLFAERLQTDPSLLLWKTQTAAEAKERLSAARTWIAEKSEVWFADANVIEQDVRTWIAEREWGNGDTLWPLRVALSGQRQSPGPFELLVAYGKARSLTRIDEAIASLVSCD